MAEEKKIAYRKTYSLRAVGDGGFEVMIPKIIVEREASKVGLTPDEFSKHYKVVHLFNDFKNIAAAYRFEPIKEEIEEIEVPQVE